MVPERLINNHISFVLAGGVINLKIASGAALALARASLIELDSCRTEWCAPLAGLFFVP